MTYVSQDANVTHYIYSLLKFIEIKQTPDGCAIIKREVEFNIGKCAKFTVELNTCAGKCESTNEILSVDPYIRYVYYILVYR